MYVFSMLLQNVKNICLYITSLKRLDVLEVDAWKIFKTPMKNTLKNAKALYIMIIDESLNDVVYIIIFS